MYFCLLIIFRKSAARQIRQRFVKFVRCSLVSSRVRQKFVRFVKFNLLIITFLICHPKSFFLPAHIQKFKLFWLPIRTPIQASDEFDEFLTNLMNFRQTLDEPWWASNELLTNFWHISCKLLTNFWRTLDEPDENFWRTERTWRSLDAQICPKHKFPTLPVIRECKPYHEKCKVSFMTTRQSWPEAPASHPTKFCCHKPFCEPLNVHGGSKYLAYLQTLPANKLSQNMDR